MLAIGFPSGEDGFGILEAVLEKTLAGNLILFARNGSDAKTAAVSAARARNLVFAVTGTEPLVAIDQEGGTVSRIRKGLTPIPGAMAQSAAFLGGGAMLSDIEELGEVCGAELYSLGINWNLAPVTDVNVNPLNPVIGVRSYGEDPCLVAAMTSAFARGLAKSGVVATAKHFPGHGDTVQDSHLDLPLVPHGFPRLDDVELLPFKRLIVEGIPTIMTAHLRFSVVEPDPLPATLSPRVLRGLLRGELGFSGLICSDCMEMKAIADRHADPYIRAVEAGVDLLFVNHTAEAQKRAAASLLEALASGRISEARIDESVARILELKARYTGQLGGVRERPSSSRAAAISIASLTILHSSSLAVGAEGRLAAGKLRLIVDFAPTNSSEMEDRSDSPSVSGELAASSIPSLRLSSDPGGERGLKGPRLGWGSSSSSSRRGAGSRPCSIRPLCAQRAGCPPCRGTGFVGNFAPYPSRGPHVQSLRPERRPRGGKKAWCARAPRSLQLRIFCPGGHRSGRLPPGTDTREGKMPGASPCRARPPGRRKKHKESPCG